MFDSGYVVEEMNFLFKMWFLFLNLDVKKKNGQEGIPPAVDNDRKLGSSDTGLIRWGGGGDTSQPLDYCSLALTLNLSKVFKFIHHRYRFETS